MRFLRLLAFGALLGGCQAEEVVAPNDAGVVGGDAEAFPDGDFLDGATLPDALGPALDLGLDASEAPDLQSIDGATDAEEADSGIAPDAGCDMDCEVLRVLRDSLQLIPAGQFLMGSPRDQPGALGLEIPQHEVTLTRDFWIGSTEVTRAQYRAVLGLDPSHFDCEDDCPVENVNWYDAIEFCNALSRIDGLEECYTPGQGEWLFAGLDCTGYRLPTEAEWEYAARAGTTTAFYNGDLTNLEIDQTISCPIIDPLSDLTAWNCGNSGLQPHPVAQKLPNDFGLYDVYGNVWEWVNDWEGYYSAEAQTDPLGAVNSRDRKVRRGGSYRDVARYSRSATRVPDLLSGFHWCIGFRIARTAGP